MVLLQEEFGLSHPWRVLAVCILLNRTQGAQARPVIGEFFRRWPTPEAFQGADPGVVRALIEPLGLLKRGAYLTRMTAQFLDRNLGDDVTGYSGCGAYAQEAYDMLVLGRRWRWPKDPVLRRRMEELL